MPATDAPFPAAPTGGTAVRAPDRRDPGALARAPGGFPGGAAGERARCAAVIRVRARPRVTTSGAPGAAPRRPAPSASPR
ncbi:hypothetical protein [Streptomyces sp. F-1]|uniref:hypothetical protein n=1 Tax=Streptomyces sp. F-1 TaxID=463642 RepID=UPI00085CC7C0|nr:hypothetical protein [Streptomyces sp. F-1]SFY53979.1 hypothetical protein STEPF1_07273 [Streptomyces sp. F-1]